MTVVIGLTGPIGCGKSTVARWLWELGAAIVDADGEARAVLDVGEPTLERVYDAFGVDLRRPDGSLDRAVLGRVVFDDPAALRRLEGIVHPVVRQVIVAAIEVHRSARVPALVIEAIKLVEGGLAALCDETWLVACSPDVQWARILGRGAEATDAERRIAAQIGMADRIRPHATRVIDTSGSIAETRALVEVAYAEALAQSSPSRRSSPSS